MTATHTPLDWARAYLRIGMHPIPCRPRSKIPMVQWREFQGVSPTSAQVEAWWTETPDANVALVLGRGIFAVDCDGGERAEALLRVHGIELPSDAPRNRTANGFHVFLSSAEPIPDRVGLVTGPTGGKPQVDIRGIGIVVVPPSIHPTGVKYEWERPLSADTSPPLASEALIRLIVGGGTSPVIDKPATPSAPTGQSWVKDTLRGVGEGQRDHACTRLAGYFLGRGVDAGTVETLLTESFARNCTPPFDAKSVQKCVRSIVRRDSVAGEDQAVTPRRLGDVLLDLQRTATDGPPPVISTPFPTLNHFLTGGFSPGELIYLGARPGIGKTAFGLELARWTAQHAGTVLVVSREMTNLALARRIVAQDARVKATVLKRMTGLNAVEQHALTASYDRLAWLPLWMTDEAVSLNEVNAIVGEMTREVELSLLVVDYLQLIRAPRDIKERRHQIEAVSQGLKTLALQHKMPVLCLSSLSRPGDRANQKPTLSSLRESGELEHDADIIMFLHRDYHQEATECSIQKNRDGRLGTVNLLFRADYVAFDECALQGDD